MKRISEFALLLAVCACNNASAALIEVRHDMAQLAAGFAHDLIGCSSPKLVEYTASGSVLFGGPYSITAGGCGISVTASASLIGGNTIRLEGASTGERSRPVGASAYVEYVLEFDVAGSDASFTVRNNSEPNTFHLSSARLEDLTDNVRYGFDGFQSPVQTVSLLDTHRYRLTTDDGKGGFDLARGSQDHIFYGAQFVQAPEPATLALLAVGLIGVASGTRRRRLAQH